MRRGLFTSRGGWAAWTLATAVVVVTRSGPTLAERPSAPRLLPDNTAALLWVPDAPELAERFMNTALGQISQDPQLKPLVNQLYGSLAEGVATVQDRIGLSLSELLAIPQGELCIAVVAPDDEQPQLVALLDVGDQLSNARKLLDRVTDAIDRSGAEKSQQTVADTKILVYDGVGERRRKLIFLEKDSTVVIGSSVEVLKGILTVWNGGEGRTLGQDKDFAAIMQRSGSADQKPDLVWYADPIALMRSIGYENPGTRLALAMFPALGLDGVKALGGSYTLDAGQFDAIIHAHLSLDSPRTGIPKMIALEPGSTEPEPWVPADVGSYTTLNWDFQTTFDTLESLFDSFRGKGALASMLEKRFKEPLGLDVQQELLPALAGRVTHCNWLERPVTIRSQATLVAFQLVDPKAFNEVLQKVVKKNEAFLTRHSYGGKEYFRYTPPRLGDEQEGPPRPIPCFGIVGDYLAVTDRPSIYEKAIVTAAGSSESLADSLDFKLIASKIAGRSGGIQPGMISFERPQEGMRVMYELAVSDNAREQLRRQGEDNPFLKSLGAALDEHPLPPFAVIEQYLAPSGAMVVDDETGLHYTAFSLRRQTDTGE